MRQIRNGLYDLFPPCDFTSFNKIANTIAITKVTTRLITPMASVFLITRKRLHRKITAGILQVPQKKNEAGHPSVYNSEKAISQPPRGR